MISYNLSSDCEKKIKSISLNTNDIDWRNFSYFVASIKWCILYIHYLIWLFITVWPKYYRYLYVYLDQCGPIWIDLIRFESKPSSSFKWIEPLLKMKTVFDVFRLNFWVPHTKCTHFIRNGFQSIAYNHLSLRSNVN